MPLAGSIGRTGTPIRLQTQTFRMMVMGKTATANIRMLATNKQYV